MREKIMDSNNNSANTKLEPGMMCLVIGCYHPEFSPIIGTTVTLIESLIVDDLEMWRCEEFIGHEPDYIQSRFLMPIRPEEDPLEMSIQSIEDYLDSKQKEKA